MGMKMKSAYKASRTSMFAPRLSRRSGLLSLTNIGGRFVYKEYLRGNDADDLRRDWQAVGRYLSASMKQIMG